MASPLEGALAQTIGKAMGGLFYECSLIRETPGSTSPPYSPWAPGPSTTVDYPCKGMVDTFSAYERTNTLIAAGDVKVLVLAATLDIAPTTADKVSIRGTEYAIVDVSTDPATAVWTLQCRI
jgi:hypothetical protein